MQTSTLNFIYFLAAIGAFVFIVLVAKLVWVIIKAILPGKNFESRYGPRSWAVVTGGSDGIGLGFCEELAALGFNICMIARNEEKMKTALDRIKEYNEKLNIKTKCIVADFQFCQKDNFFQHIRHQLKDLDVSILVNNVGISNMGYLHEIPDQRLLNQINVNCVPMVLLSHYMIPKMLGRPTRSAIINISSFSAEHPIPYASTYCATKAFNNFFSQAIEMEYSHKLDILSVRPLYVESNMSKQQKSCTVASKNEFAQSSLKYLGIQYESNGFYMHRFLSYLTKLLPEPIIRCATQSESRKIMETNKKEQIEKMIKQ